MRTKILGLLTSLALLGGGAALAGQQSSQSQQQGEIGTSQQPGQSGIGGAGQEGYGGSGQMGQQGQTGQQGQQGQMGGQAQVGQIGQQNQVLGRVLKSERNEVYVEQPNGAVVELKVDRNTQFADPAVKSPKDFRQGQEISANIQRKGTDNFATRISPAEPGMMQGYGGAGQQPGTVNQPAFPSPSGVRRSDQGGIQTPEEPGTGGSGDILIVPEENPNVPSTGTENEPGRLGTGEESGGQGGIRSQGGQSQQGSQTGEDSGTGGSGEDGTKGY